MGFPYFGKPPYGCFCFVVLVLAVEIMGKYLVVGYVGRWESEWISAESS